MSCGCNEPQDTSRPSPVYSGEAYRVIQITKKGTRKLWAYAHWQDRAKVIDAARAHKDTLEVILEPMTFPKRSKKP